MLFQLCLMEFDISQIPYTMGKQVSFDLFAAFLYAFAAGLNTKNLDMKWIISTGAAFLASIVACLFSQPGDMILTATYKGKGDAGRGFSSIVQSIYKKHGMSGFFLGVQARLAHVASIITTQLVIYDIVKMSLGLPVTGSH